MTNDLRDKLCLSMDTDDRPSILRAAEELSDLAAWLKLNSAFTHFGPDLISDLLDRDVKIFLDLKLHDIPNTVAGYARAVTRLGVHLVTLHTVGGTEMLRAAVDAADDEAARLGIARPRFVGVTVLTSIDEEALQKDEGVSASVEFELRRRALLAADAGLDGIVCAPTEISAIRSELPEEFFYVTPGTRSTSGTSHDHRRTGTPSQALADGSSLLVLGRRVFGAGDARAALVDVHNELGASV